jgi:CRISPR-associated endoribonuclease Cas6
MKLLSLVCHVRPERPATLPPHLGRAAHAALLRILHEADPALAAHLHDEDGPKPFTCTSLIGPRGRAGEVEPRERYWLRFTALNDAVAHALSAWTRSPAPRLELDGILFAVEEIATAPSQHPWAAESTYEEVGKRWLIPRPAGDGTEAALPWRIGLQFTTPTAFRSGGKQIPVPLPDLVFGSLVERWNAYAPITLAEEARRYGAECVAISRYALRSRAVGYKESAVKVGATGECWYSALNRDRYWLAVLNLLADFAFWSGVGTQTAIGMGQVRRVRSAER